MKSFLPFAATSLVLATQLHAAAPGGFNMEAINTTLPLEGAPKAIPGSYATTSEPALGNANLKIIRPADLDKFPKQDTLPVVVWGNGGCAMENAQAQGFFETIASHGFLVVTTTAVPAHAARPRWRTSRPASTGPKPRTRAPARRWPARSRQRRSPSWASPAAACSRCSSAPTRVTTIGVFNSGAQGDMKALVAALHGPVLLINGGDRDPLMGLSHDTFNAIDKLPTFYGSRHGAGHTATLYHPGGGEWANVAWNWAQWQLKGDKQAAKMFVGKKCELCTNTNWDVEQKRLEK